MTVIEPLFNNGKGLPNLIDVNLLRDYGVTQSLFLSKSLKTLPIGSNPTRQSLLDVQLICAQQIVAHRIMCLAPNVECQNFILQKLRVM